MKNVPELRFAGFDGEWEEKTIKDTSNIIGGGTPSTKNLSYWDGNINWFTPAEIFNKRYYENSERKISDLGIQKSSAKILNKDKTVLFTSRASIGNIGLLLKDSATNQGFQSLEIKDGYNLDFMYSLCETILKKALSMATGSTFKEISKNSIENIDINIPYLKEQEKIGNLFKKIDDLIEIQEGKVSKMENFKKSMLQKMFPKKDELVPEFRFDGFDGEWETDKLKNILNYRRGSFPQPYTEDRWYGGKDSMPFVQVNDVATSSFKLKENTKNTISTIAIPKSVFVEKGTILVTIQGSIGRIALTQYDSYVDRTLLIITDSIIKFDKFFLMHVLYLLFYKEKFKASGGTIKSITTKKLGDFKISFPSIREQQKIGRFFKNLDIQIENEEKLLDSYKMMKKSLLQKMFV